MDQQHSTSPTAYQHLEERAKRYDQSGNKTTAARFYRLAGEAAVSAYANDEALTYFQAALDRTSDAQAETRYKLRFAIDQLYALTNKTQERSRNLVDLATLADVLDSDEKRADVAARLALFKLDSGEHEDVISISRLATRLAQLAQATAAEADLNLVWGRALLRLTQYDSAKSKFQRAQTVAQKHNLIIQEANSIRYLGVLSEENNQFYQAKQYYKEALALYEKSNHALGKSDTLNNLGKVAFEQGKYSAAHRYWDHAKPSYLAIGDKSGLARMLINQSALCLDVGDYSQAESYSQDALTLSQEIGLKFGESLSLMNMALANYYQGQTNSAFSLANQALQLATKMGSKRLTGYAHNTLGRALLAQDKASEADEQYWHAVAIWHELEQKSLSAEAYAGLIEVALQQNDSEQAQTYLESILPALLAGDTFEGTESPFRIYWIGYQALKATNNPRAADVLETAHALLQARANKILDEALRKTFLEQVEIHRLITEEASAL